MADDMIDVRMSDGCNLKVKVLGDAPNKPVMIANHGAPGLATHKEPLSWCSSFVDRFKIIVFDMRGSGDSDQKRPYTHKRWAEDIEEVRQWAKIDKFTMVGASHGGCLALEYALAYPQHVNALVVGDSAAQLSHWGAMNMIAKALTDPRIKPDPDQVVRILSGTCFDEADYLSAFAAIAPLYAAPDEIKDKAEGDVGKVLGEATKVIFETNSAAMNDCISRYDVRDRLHEISVPTFVFVGRHDWICPVQCSEFVANGISNAKLVIFEDSGHLPGVEEKTLFKKELDAFFDENGL